MTMTPEVQAQIDFQHSRCGMYGFLSRLYRVEADQELIDQIKTFHFIDDFGSEEMSRGYDLINKAITNHLNLENLAVDYAKVFLGFGPKKGEGAFPYESVYTSVRGLLMQEARDQVMSLYQAEHLQRDSSFVEPEDHIAFELMFMAFYCQKTAEALQQGETALAQEYEQKQIRFIQNHLLNWVPRFCKETLRVSDTAFYQGAAHLTAGFLAWEKEMLITLRSVDEDLCS